jgi:uncharacterized protein (TIGR02271 family)
MAYAEYTVVTDAKGVRGVIDPQRLEGGHTHVTVLLQGGQEVQVRAGDLVRRDNGTYYIPHSLTALLEQRITGQVDSDGDNEAVIPVIEEQVRVDKQWVESGRVRITRRTHEEEQVINDTVLHEEVNVERVAINRAIDTLVETRYEGDTLVIPIIEEELVIEKRLILKEEVRVTRRQVETPVSQPVTVHKEEVIVQHIRNDDK